MVTIGIAALSAILVWVENIYSYIESEPEYSDLYFYSSQIPGISRDLAIITLALLIQRLATLRQARWTRNLAVISTSLVIIAWLHALTMVEEPGEERWFYMSAGTLIAVGIGFASKFFLLATIWSARILEDVPPEDAEMDGL